MTNHDDQHEAIEFLMRPATYGAKSVERIDTHTSIVFLAGERAYKLKQAVKFSYLDYSTVDARRHFCELELKLNRRTAPDLYLEVRPIARTTSGQLAFLADGPAVDWVLVMRRFHQNCLLDRMADRNQLSVALMLDLAGQIASFHETAEVVRERGGHPGAADTAASNALNLRLAAPGLLEAISVDRLIELTEHSLTAHAALLERRREAGKVRHCHGDLHLRNVCLIDGRPTLFDCIEFNTAIACIDVLYDLAFLLMDLHHRRLEHLGNAVFNRYLDLREEGDGLAALPLFMSMRAAVRSHVSAAAVGAQPRLEARSRMARMASDYLAVALALLRPSPARLVAIGGLSGTGKSTLAYGLAPHMGRAPGARVLRSDVIRKRLFGTGLTQPLSEEAYREEVSAKVYDRLCEEAARLLAAGHCVIADAVYASPAQRRAIAEVAHRAGRPFAGLWLDAVPDILERRLAARHGDASDATPMVLRRQLDFDVGPIEWQRIDAAGGPAAVAAAARVALDA